MKKVLSVISVVTVVLVLGVTSVNHYKEYKNTLKAQEKTQSIARDSEENSLNYLLNSQNIDLKKRYNTQVKECEKGRAIYDKLTETQKKQSQIPVCGKAL